MKERRKSFQLAGLALVIFGGIAVLFILLEFANENSKIVPFINGLLDSECTSAGLLVGAVCVIAFGVFTYYLVKWIRTANYQHRRYQNLKLLGSMMFLLWSAGWALFLQAFLFFPPDYLFVNSELLLRSAIASLKMFVLDIDSNILDTIPGHAHLRGAISFVSLLSFACTVGLLISLISARLWAYLKLSYRSHVNSEHSHLYLFWGMNQHMELLADSISKYDKKSIRIFVERTKNDEDDGNEGWNHLVTMMTHRRESFKKVRRMDARLALTSCNISGLANVTDVFGEAELSSIKKKINKLKDLKEGAELHVFFLSANEGENIESVGVIRKDQTINAVAAYGVKVVIYCQARRNSVTRVIEHKSLDSPVEVRVIDSAHLSVDKLKMEENIGLQPVSFVKFKGDGTTASEFNSLVIGFNEVGQDIVRFLYEYGAFVCSDKSDGVKRSPFCCHVVDPDMKKIAPHYMDMHLRIGEPKTGDTFPLISVDSVKPAYIKLHSYDYKDQKFFSLLNTICDTLNYVVIATGDDMEGAMLAVWILKHAMRQKKDLRNFKILLRSYSSEKTAHVDNIIKYYNGLFYAEMVNQAKLKPENENGQDRDIIHVFGRPENTYSFQSIVSNMLRMESWLYYNSYNGVIEKTDKDFAALSDEDKASGKYCSKSKPDYAWNVRRQKELISKIDGSPRYSQVMSVRRKEAQDMENALHRHTKRMVALKALGDEMTLQRIGSEIRNGTIRRNEHNIYFENDKCHSSDNDYSSLNKLMTTLAQMEHLRWIASHQMLGYVHGSEKDDACSMHSCLVDWDSLESDEVRGYDYEVVERSFIQADVETGERNKKY